jgi:YggT family protein
MLERIFVFLLETSFFLLIGASLLRGWMNWTRISMREQPGSFVMAITNWLVIPLRRFLPTTILKSRIDWASLIGAALLALAYGLLLAVMFGSMSGADGIVLPSTMFALLGFAVKMLLRVALQTLLILVFGFAILSWVQPGSPAYALLGRLIDPLITPLRRVIPTVGGIDLSILALLVLLQIGLMVVS